MDVGFEAHTPSTQSNKLPKPLRPSRPNYNKLHSQPLPLKIYPLPPLIPHNPLSLLQIASIYVSQLLFRPSSHPQTLLRGYFSADTSSVHVTDEATARILWEQGFFGKGSLSRSEPSWLARKETKQGLVAGDTSEEVTRRRREERKQFKQDRARKEREAIEEKLAEESKAGSQSPVDGNAPWILETFLEPSAVQLDLHTKVDDQLPTPNLDHISSMSTLVPGVNERSTSSASETGLDVTHVPSHSAETLMKAVVNQEHLQLTLEEAFFLVYGLGILEVQDASNFQKLSTSRLFSICRSHSYFPPQLSTSLSTDDPFLLSYVVYHHFRSLGWVVRPGIKFAVDYLLYNRGPVFSHAEFAVIVRPAYSHSYWSSTAASQAGARRKEKKSWWWIHCVNRVQTQVRKSLVVAFVEIPLPVDAGAGAMNEAAEATDIGQLLTRYRVRELILKRWTPNRSRD
ncbi:MAG: hypothetical protein Q9201_003924 [Fulgogasparrea decipioides]